MRVTPTCELHVITAKGFLQVLRTFDLSFVQSRVIALLGSHRGRIFSMKEIIADVHGVSEGPEWSRQSINCAVFKLRRRGVAIRAERNRGYYLETAL